MHGQVGVGHVARKEAEYMHNGGVSACGLTIPDLVQDRYQLQACGTQVRLAWQELPSVNEVPPCSSTHSMHGIQRSGSR